MHNKTKTDTELPQTIGSTLNNRSSTEPPTALQQTAAQVTGGLMHFTSAKSSP